MIEIGKFIDAHWKSLLSISIIFFALVLGGEVGVGLIPSLHLLVINFIDNHAVQPWFRESFFLIVITYPIVFVLSLTTCRLLSSFGFRRFAIAATFLPAINILLIIFGFLGY